MKHEQRNREHDDALDEVRRHDSPASAGGGIDHRHRTEDQDQPMHLDFGDQHIGENR